MNYYNEFDHKAAAWLRVLIKHGHIAPGVVDERSIHEVRAADLTGFVQCHFFAGIGGWSHAMRLAGWPDNEPVWTGSCPCQPFSVAGKGLGTKDPRHLWPQFRRLIRQCRPAIVFGEQVASGAGRDWLDGVCADLEALAYGNAAADLCAASAGAPHIRQRLYWMANTDRARRTRAGQAQPTQWRRDLESAGRSEIGGVAYARHGQRGRGNKLQSRWETPTEREKETIQPDGCGSTFGLVAAASERRFGTSDSDASPRRDGVEIASGTGRLGDAAESGSQGRVIGVHVSCERAAGDAGVGGWSGFEIIPCADGNSRRIESGTFPLAHGVPGRVGLLRGYGNAIVPQLAAKFIEASRDALTDSGVPQSPKPQTQTRILSL